MATITDDDLKMFQERAKTEFASRCDTGGIAWDSVIWDLCNEVRRLRSASKESERGDCAKLREALAKARHFIDSSPLVSIEDSTGTTARGELCAEIDAALAAPSRNCDRFGGDIDKLREACARERGLNPEEDFPDVFPDWLLAPSTEKKGDAK